MTECTVICLHNAGGWIVLSMMFSTNRIATSSSWRYIIHHTSATEFVTYEFYSQHCCQSTIWQKIIHNNVTTYTLSFVYYLPYYSLYFTFYTYEFVTYDTPSLTIRWKFVYGELVYFVYWLAELGSGMICLFCLCFSRSRHIVCTDCRPQIACRLGHGWFDLEYRRRRRVREPRASPGNWGSLPVYG